MAFTEDLGYELGFDAEEAEESRERGPRRVMKRPAPRRSSFFEQLEQEAALVLLELTEHRIREHIEKSGLIRGRKVA